MQSGPLSELQGVFYMQTDARTLQSQKGRVAAADAQAHSMHAKTGL